MTLRKRLYLTLEPTEKGGYIESIFEFVLVFIIIANILAIVFDSVPDIHTEYEDFFKKIELYSVLFFTVEYVARLYSIVESPKYRGDIKGRLRFIVSTLAIIDLMAFMPFYLTFLPFDLRFLRIFRLMALFSMFKIARYLHALSVFKKVLIDRKDGLYFVGRTEFDSPEVDNEVLLDASVDYATVGSFVNVKVDSAEDFDLYGHIVK